MTKISTESLVNGHGESIAVLDWRANGNSTEFACIDDGTIARRPDGTVRVRMQDGSTGHVTVHEMPDPVTAFYALGLSVERRNGIDGWLYMTLAPGLAGRD